MPCSRELGARGIADGQCPGEAGDGEIALDQNFVQIQLVAESAAGVGQRAGEPGADVGIAALGLAGDGGNQFRGKPGVGGGPVGGIEGIRPTLESPANR